MCGLWEAGEAACERGLESCDVYGQRPSQGPIMPKLRLSSLGRLESRCVEDTKSLRGWTEL